MPLARGEVVTDEPEQPVAGVRIGGEVRHVRKALHQRAALPEQLLLQLIDIGPAADHVDAPGEILLFERGVDAHEVAAQPAIELIDRIGRHHGSLQYAGVARCTSCVRRHDRGPRRVRPITGAARG